MHVLKEEVLKRHHCGGFKLASLMFVASYARLPSVRVRDTTSVPLHYGSGPLLQCAVPPRFAAS